MLPCLCRLQMNIMYQCDAWSWIRIWVNIVLHGHFQNHLPVNVVKFYILSVLIMVNSTYYLVLSWANTMCVGVERNWRSYLGFVSQPNTLLQCTRLDSNKSLTVGAVEYFRIMKHFLLHYYILIVWKSLIGRFVQKCVLEIMACDLNVECVDRPLTGKQKTMVKRIWG